jgi:hypothetical protein
MLAGAQVSWASLPGSRSGCCLWKDKHIILAPWLFWCTPWFIRDVWSHELAHCVVGPSQERARAWQQLVYGREQSFSPRPLVHAGARSLT